MKPELSLILPIYNQADHIAKLTSVYGKFLSTFPNTEIIFVVNGTTDNSYQLLLKAAAKEPRFKVFSIQAGGWGRAVIYGLNKAEGDYVGYTNSARTRLSDLVSIYKVARALNGYVVKASRMVRHETLRRIGSVLYNFEARLLFRVPIWDINGTPKIFPAQVNRIVSLVETGDVIDAEFIVKCFAAGFPVIEVPVTAPKRLGGGSTTNWKSAFTMYAGLFRLKRRFHEPS